MQKINILGVQINKITYSQVLSKIQEFLNSKEKHYIVTPNPEFVMTAQKDKEFKEILNKADIAIPDGIGLLWAATLIKSKIKNQRLKLIRIYLRAFIYGLFLILYPKYCRKVLPERITGVDLIWKISKLCEQKNCSIFLLGAKKGRALACALKLKQKFPNLKITGTFSGLAEPASDEKIRMIINQTKPDILFVAFGAPKQEKWIARNLAHLETVKIAMGVGGAFDFIAKTVRRAPKFFQKAGIEWLWRFLFQPWRFSRIFTATFKFSQQVITNKIKAY